MDILEFRESYINEDINAEAINTSRYPVEVFIDSAADILKKRLFTYYRYEPMFLFIF